MKQRVMGIRLRKPAVYFDDIEQAAKETNFTENTIVKYINHGLQTKNGWCFDYEIEKKA